MDECIFYIGEKDYIALRSLYKLNYYRVLDEIHDKDLKTWNTTPKIQEYYLSKKDPAMSIRWRNLIGNWKFKARLLKIENVK